MNLFIFHSLIYGRTLLGRVRAIFRRKFQMINGYIWEARINKETCNMMFSYYIHDMKKNKARQKRNIERRKGCCQQNLR